MARALLALPNSVCLACASAAEFRADFEATGYAGVPSRIDDESLDGRGDPDVIDPAIECDDPVIGGDVDLAGAEILELP